MASARANIHPLQRPSKTIEKAGLPPSRQGARWNPRRTSAGASGKFLNAGASDAASMRSNRPLVSQSAAVVRRPSRQHHRRLRNQQTAIRPIVASAAEVGSGTPAVAADPSY